MPVDVAPGDQRIADRAAGDRDPRLPAPAAHAPILRSPSGVRPESARELSHNATPNVSPSVPADPPSASSPALSAGGDFLGPFNAPLQGGSATANAQSTRQPSEAGTRAKAAQPLARSREISSSADTTDALSASSGQQAPEPGALKSAPRPPAASSAAASASPPAAPAVPGLAAPTPTAQATPPPPTQKKQESAAPAFSARNQSRVQALARAPMPEFTSADGKSSWRLGASGHIERSTDQGQTWQPQSSGVTSDLSAGSAPSAQVAWIAGARGVILRTTDGTRWTRVPPPAASGADNSSLDSSKRVRTAPTSTSVDWISVEAQDALHATVVSRDLRRFATADGGRTWMEQ